MQKIIFTKGLIASGKSTYAKQFVKDNQNYKRLCRDDFRHMCSSYSYTDENEKLVTKLMNEAITVVLLNGYNLVLDNMHLNEKAVKEQKEFIKNIKDKNGNYLDIKFEVKEFPISLAEAIERDAKREFSLGKSVIKSTYDRYEVQCKQMIKRHKPVYPVNVK